MTFKQTLFFFLFLFFINNATSNEKFNAKEFNEIIFKRYPSIANDLIHNKYFKYPLIPIQKLQQSEHLSNISKTLITFQNKILHLNGKPLIYRKKYHANWGNYNRSAIIYKWEFNIPEKADYLIVQGCKGNTAGYLNQKPILRIDNSILSYQSSGIKFFQLEPGLNQVVLIKRSYHDSKLMILPKKTYTEIKLKVLEKLISNDESDILWVLKNLVSLLGKKGHGAATLIKNLLNSAPYRTYMDKHPKVIIDLYKVYNNTFQPYTLYILNKNLFKNKPTLFIEELATKNLGGKKKRNFNLKGFLEQGILDNDNQIVFEVIEKAILFKKKTHDEKEIITFSLDLYKSIIPIYYGYTQNIGGSLAKSKVKKLTEKAQSLGVKIKPISYEPDLRAGDLIISDATEESQTLNTKRLILDYKNEDMILKTCFDRFLNIKPALIKSGEKFSSIRNIFIKAVYQNKLFLNDFKRYCQVKLSNKLKQSILKKDMKTLHEIITQFSMILELPDAHQALGQYYFNNGSFEKAYFHLSWLSKLKKDISPTTLSKIYLLEDYCDILPQNRLRLNSSQNKQVLIEGKKVSLTELKAKLKNNKIYKALSPGKLIKRIPLPTDDIQYWNHPLKSSHQGVEPTFTASKLLLSTSTSLLVHDIKDGSQIWKEINTNEYHVGSENGPHQKRFVLEHSGPNIYQFSCMSYSNKKVIKSFKLNGDLNWNMMTFKGMEILEPTSAPIAHGGNLFFISTSNNQTIRSTSFTAFNPLKGEIHYTIPLGVIPTEAHGKNHWNTFRHDQHFTKEGRFIYGYSGTGILFKVDAIAQNLLWGQSYHRKSGSQWRTFSKLFGFAPSGYIKIFKNIIVTYMPGAQTFSGTNKHTGQQIWRSNHLQPMHIHGRNSNDFLYFSEHKMGQTPNLIKLDPQTGNTIWKTDTSGLRPQGEGEVTEKYIIIPCLRSLVFFDKKDGQLVKRVPLKLQPLKLVYGHNRWILFTKKDAFLLNNAGDFDSTLLKRSPFKETGFIKPDSVDMTLPYDSLSLEKSLYIPTRAYTSSHTDPKLVSTALPNHHILKLGSHITLFREGFKQQSGNYIQPSVLWYSQIPHHCLLKDRIVISEPGEIRVEDLFTRKVLWQYLYEYSTPITKASAKKTSLSIASNEKYTAFNTPFGTVRILDSNTHKHLYDLRIGSIKSLVVIGSVLMVSKGHLVEAYNLDKRGSFLWKKTTKYSFILSIEGDKLVNRAHKSGTEYTEPKTGASIVKINNGLPTMSGQNTRVFGTNYCIAYNLLYETKTGGKVKKFNEARDIKNGGYLCFYKLGDNKGQYIEGDKFYDFQLKGRRDRRGCQLTGLKKGNKLIIMSTFFIETVEIKENKLTTIDFIHFKGSHFTGKDGTSLYALDNSLMKIRIDQMFFFRQFDPFNHYSKIKSFRVSNKTKSEFPYSEVYPEIKLNKNNWIPNNGSKPNREIYYQIFANNKKAFLHFKLSPLKNKDEKTILQISCNHQGYPIMFTWNPDLWEHCTTKSGELKGTEKSWKELDQDGSIHLYITLPLDTIYRRYRQTLPDFCIEFRQYKNAVEKGLYRVGGASYYSPRSYGSGSMKHFDWDIYKNDEAQTLKNFHLRSNMYFSGEGFFPQGLELQKWIIDSRRFNTLEENISMIKSLAKKNSKSFCIVNILVLLLKEDLNLFKSKNQNLLDFDPKFYDKIKTSKSMVNTFAKAIGVKQEWINFALTFYTIEVFPSKNVVGNWRGSFYQPLQGHYISGPRHLLIATNNSSANDPAINDINKPHLQFLFPGLLTGYPKEKSFNKIGLKNVLGPTTCLGKITKHEPESIQELCDRSFSKSSIPVFLRTRYKLIPVKSFARNYYFDKKTYKGFFVKGVTMLNDIEFKIPDISIPSVTKDKGLEYENILISLKNLPSDSYVGSALMSTIASQKINLKPEDHMKLYEIWLSKIKQNQNSFSNAMKYIHSQLTSRKISSITMYKDLFKKTKIPTSLQRIFLLNYYYKIGRTPKWSFLGPFKGNLIDNPHEEFDPKKVYSDGTKSYTFNKLKFDKSSYYYIAINVTSSRRKNAYLYVRDTSRNSSSSMSVWLNSKQALDSTFFFPAPHQMIIKKITLKKGENIVLIKIFAYDVRYCSLAIGDKKGYPIKGITMKGVH
ncbi:MAG: hypothetical protein COA79_03750 [Planctomycetota bacterium]|nr:MAG: hypothetical protein COA79_03750 [Planctomycetota bacterium]